MNVIMCIFNTLSTDQPDTFLIIWLKNLNYFQPNFMWYSFKKVKGDDLFFLSDKWGIHDTMKRCEFEHTDC